MTTYTRFTPSTTVSPPFQFTATLDDDDYIISATWNVYGQTWYIKCSDLSGNVIRTEPLIASPDNGDIPLFPGIFSTSKIVYRDSSSNFEVS